MDTYLGFKICKYCDSYFSPEGTWKKDKEGNWICQDCQLKFSNEEDQEEEEKENYLRNFFKYFWTEIINFFSLILLYNK